MDEKLLARYQNLSSQVTDLEQLIEKRFKSIERKDVIEHGRNIDYCERGFVIQLYFDEINVNALKKEDIEQLVKYLVDYAKLRKEQRDVEGKVAQEAKMERLNRDSIKGILWFL